MDSPSNSKKNAPNKNYKSRTVCIDKPPLDRDEPRFKQNEECKSPLDGGAIPSKFLLNVGDKKRPAVLVVRNHDHCAHANGQLHPPISIVNAGYLRSCPMDCIGHQFLP